MFYKKALSSALKSRPDLKYEGDGSYEDVVKFLDREGFVFQDENQKPIKLTKGLTISVTPDDNPPDQATFVDNSEMSEAEYDEGETEEKMEDEDEAEGKTFRARQRGTRKHSGHTASDLRRLQMPTSKAGSSAAARREKRYDADVRNGRKRVFGSGEEANRFAALFRYQWSKNCGRDYATKAEDRQIIGKATASTIDNSLGGALLAAEEFRPELIDLLNDHGAARQLLTVIPSNGSPVRLPRKSSDVTASWAVEGVAPSDTTVGVDSVSLSPQKLMAVATLTNELLNFSQYDAADLYAASAVRAMSEKEDQAFFNGDGTSTYGNIVGLANVLDATAITAGSGNSYGAITDADINKAISTVLSKAITQGQPGWSMTTNAYHGVFTRVNRGLGGTDAVGGEGYNGGGQAYGYGVTFNNVTQAASAADKIFAYFGDFNMAAKMIEVPQSFEIAFDASESFSSDVTKLRVKEFIDINVHDGGSSAGSDSPVIAIKTSS